jgi:ribosome-binding factor A
MNLDLRYAPHLHFARDTAEENASRIGELLEGISKKTDLD